MFYSQIAQDEWVYSVLGDKKNGYFIELGGGNGISLSNTLFFERTLQWDGICIEPNPAFRDAIRSNRTCNISYNCVSDIDNVEIDFAACGLLSGIVETAESETIKDNIIKVKTKTLKRILDEFNAPKTIDYLSLDVEGHEYRILQSFPFDEYQINCITVEHNEPHHGSEKRNKIRKLLEENRYVFIKGNDDVNNWGHGPIDDFYVHSSIAPISKKIIS